MKTSSEKKHESGSVLIMVAVFMFLLLGFIAAGVDAGRWYLVRAELAKSVDAGALVACSNLSNPNVNPPTLAVEYANANFPAGAVGTPSAGGGSAVFTATLLAANKVQVNGAAEATTMFAQALNFGRVGVKSLSVAQKRQVEIMMVLDRSGSMSGQPMVDLKKAATGFVTYFKSTQAEDKMGLITFDTYASVSRALGINFVTPLNTAIAGINTQGYTNAEEGIDKADGLGGFTNQAGVAPEARIAQFMIFFSDGRPNSFRYNFLNKGNTVDAIVTQQSNCDPGNVGTNVGDKLTDPTNGAQININPGQATGDGLAVGSACGNTTSTRWFIMDSYPVPGYTPTACAIPEASTLCPYVCDMASTLAIAHAAELKNANVTIYSIGYSAGVHTQFMQDIASNANMYYFAPNSTALAGIFQHIALEIKLRLVQ